MSVQGEIDRINGAKSTIAANIKDSGVSVQEGARLEVLAPLVGDIVGQFSDELDLIIGGDTTPVTDITARLSSVNGVSGDVSTQLDTLDGTKTAIKDAIVAKGVDIPEGTVFRDYASKIGEIESGVGTGELVSVTISVSGRADRSYMYYDSSSERIVTGSLNGTSFPSIKINVPVGTIIVTEDSFGNSVSTTGSIEYKKDSYFSYNLCIVKGSGSIS